MRLSTRRYQRAAIASGHPQDDLGTHRGRLTKGTTSSDARPAGMSPRKLAVWIIPTSSAPATAIGEVVNLLFTNSARNRLLLGEKPAPRAQMRRARSQEGPPPVHYKRAEGREA